MRLPLLVLLAAVLSYSARALTCAGVYNSILHLQLLEPTTTVAEIELDSVWYDVDFGARGVAHVVRHYAGPRQPASFHVGVSQRATDGAVISLSAGSRYYVFLSTAHSADDAGLRPLRMVFGACDRYSHPTAFGDSAWLRRQVREHGARRSPDHEPDPRREFATEVRLGLPLDYFAARDTGYTGLFIATSPEGFDYVRGHFDAGRPVGEWHYTRYDGYSAPTEPMPYATARFDSAGILREVGFLRVDSAGRVHTHRREERFGDSTRITYGKRGGRSGQEVRVYDSVGGERRLTRRIRRTLGADGRRLRERGYLLVGGEEVPHGPHVYFDTAGHVRSGGRFDRGRKVGAWLSWRRRRDTSLVHDYGPPPPLPDTVLAYFDDGRPWVTRARMPDFPGCVAERVYTERWIARETVACGGDVVRGTRYWSDERYKYKLVTPYRLDLKHGAEHLYAHQRDRYRVRRVLRYRDGVRVGPHPIGGRLLADTQLNRHYDERGRLHGRQRLRSWWAGRYRIAQYRHGVPVDTARVYDGDDRLVSEVVYGDGGVPVVFRAFDERGGLACNSPVDADDSPHALRRSAVCYPAGEPTIGGKLYEQRLEWTPR